MSYKVLRSVRFPVTVVVLVISTATEVLAIKAFISAAAAVVSWTTVV